MSMPAAHAEADLMTAEGLERVVIAGKRTELVRGRLVVREPPSTWHGTIAGKLTYLIGAFVYPRKLGVVCGQDTGFKIRSKPDTVRAPDVGFLVQERVGLIGRRGYAAVAPDLVAEIVSPEERPAELLEKVADWLGAGVRLVWVVDAGRAEVRVHRPDDSLSVLNDTESLVGEDVLPGFVCMVRDILN